ncbi:WD repeat-containing protein 76-like isoform X2 [Acropora palmata]|uniref:WD repeat-containing protein 76-like isoform X2 n=1 Tax=Acropora palmata TaxID=6131 RepID=UPI003DA0FFAF
MAKRKNKEIFAETPNAKKTKVVLEDASSSDLLSKVSTAKTFNRPLMKSASKTYEEDQSSELSEYERRRLENIQRNSAFVEGLNFIQVKQELLESSIPTSKLRQRGLTRPKKSVQASPLLPTRQSLRLQKKNPEGLPSLETRSQTSSPPVDERQRKVGPVEMVPRNNVDETDAKDLIDELTVLANMLHNEKLSCDIVPQNTTPESYKTAIQGLGIDEQHVVKLVPNRIFSLTFHPAKYKTLLFAGDKWGNLGVWDVGSTSGEDGVYLYEPHSRPISCMSFDPNNCGKLYTASYDGTMRCCDVASGIFQEVYTFDDDDSTRFMYFAFGSPSTDTILAATDSGYVLVVDTRTNSKVNMAEHEYGLHCKTIKCIDVHPLNSNLFLTSSNDGVVAFWDIRNLKSANSSLSTLQRSRSVTSAYFSPLTGSQVLITSMDDHVSINQVDSCGKASSAPKCCFRHDNQTGRWLTNFRATWDPKFDSYAVIGSMRYPRQIDIFSSEVKSHALMHLTHENLSSINSLTVFHPSANKLAGANSSGKVFLWTE